MPVASLNSHLYYLSASKSALKRARAHRLLSRALVPLVPPSFLPLAGVPTFFTSSRVSPGAYKEVVFLPLPGKRDGRRDKAGGFSLNEDFFAFKTLHRGTFLIYEIKGLMKTEFEIKRLTCDII